MKRVRGSFRRALRRSALLVTLAVVTALGLSALTVAALRWAPPPTTAFMLQHQLMVRGRGSPSERYTTGGSSGAR